MTGPARLSQEQGRWRLLELARERLGDEGKAVRPENAAVLGVAPAARMVVPCPACAP